MRLLAARFWTLLLLLLCGTTLSQAEPASSERPNFVFLLVDDLGWSHIASYGNPFFETPSVDRLAREGMKFTQAYAACAVCSPTRASIQTGKYPARLGVTDYIPGEHHPEAPLVTLPTRQELPLEEVCLAEALKEHGYQTAFLGKWHLGKAPYYPQHHGYDVNIAGCSAGGPPKGYFFPWGVEHIEDGPEGEYLTDRLTDEAVGLLEAYAAIPDDPFLLFLSYYTVHTPIQPRPELLAHYEKKLEATGDTRWGNPAYAGMVHAMDLSVGRVLDSLDQLGLAENTVVIFMSDNGGVDYWNVSTNHPLRAGKGRYYEGGIREPMIVRWPGTTKPGSICDTPVISTDFYPTMLAMAGLPSRPNQHADGENLVPLLQGTGKPDRDALYWHYPHYHGSGATPCSAIRVGDMKLIRYYETGNTELYDLANDLSEEHDLAADKPEQVAEMEAQLDAWLTEVGAYVPPPRPTE